MENHKSEVASKLKIPLVDSTVDKIDTTAPVNKILEDLVHRNKKAFTYYLDAFRPFKWKTTDHSNHTNHHQLVTAHPLSAFPDDWDGALNTGFFEQFTYKAFTPKMITLLKNIKKTDPVTALMQEKLKWQMKYDIMRDIGGSRRSYLQKRCEYLNDDVVYCPRVVVDIAAHLDSEPEPYFSVKSSYNWLYAGKGNLHLICVDWVDYLLHSQFNTLYLTQFSKNDLLLNSEPTATFECDTNILETVFSTQNIVALRTKLKIHILKISSGEKPIIEKVQALESELPYTSISFDDHHKNIMYVTTLDNQVILVNIDRLTKKTVKLESKGSSLVNNWHTVVGTERPYFTRITGKSITLYDKRTNKPIITWDGLDRISAEHNCNEITAVKQCEGTSNMYIATDHHIFLMDLRHNHSKIRPMQRWAHGMMSVPTYISICNFEFNKQILCFSSQWCEDTCVLPNYNPSLVKGFKGVSMVYRPPSILSTLNEAREKLLCIDLYNSIDKRLCTALSGNLIFEQGENYVVLTQNSLGDITSHVLFPEHMESFLEDDSVMNLEEWCKDYELEEKRYVVSEVADFANVWKSLKKVPETYRVGEGKYCFKTRSEFDEKEIFDIFEKEELDSGLLDVWIGDNNQTVAESTKIDDTQNNFSMNFLHYDSNSE